MPKIPLLQQCIQYKIVVQYLGVQFVIHDRYHVQYVGPHRSRSPRRELTYVVAQPIHTRLGQFYVMCKP